MPEKSSAGMLPDVLWNWDDGWSQRSVLDALRLHRNNLDCIGLLQTLQEMLGISLSPAAYALAVTTG